MDEEIKIAYDYRDIEGKSTDEKLNLLLKIAFANHAALNKHGEILFGNGKSGVCDRLRQTWSALAILWGLFVGACGVFAGFMFELAKKG